MKVGGAPRSVNPAAVAGPPGAGVWLTGARQQNTDLPIGAWRRGRAGSWARCRGFDLAAHAGRRGAAFDQTVGNPLLVRL